MEGIDQSGANVGTSDEDISIRFKTLPLGQIDYETLGREIAQDWRTTNQFRGDFLQQREWWTQNWRNLRPEDIMGPWENSSNFNIPVTLLYGKAIHARLWQLFSDPYFFGVKARREVFEDREADIRDFMQYILDQYCNGKKGTRDVFDMWVWDVVFEGTGYLKLYWQRDTHKYLEVEPKVTLTKTHVFAPNDTTGREDVTSQLSEKNVVKEEIVETPYIGRALMEDILLPRGQGDPQTSDWVKHRVFMTDYELKARAREGKFDHDQVAEALKHKGSYLDEQSSQIKIQRFETDGYIDPHGYYDGKHSIIEHYGKAYIKKTIDHQEEFEMDQMPEEVVIWVHQSSGMVLGWTYLYRVSPSGIRPIFAGNFIQFPDRSHGVGTAEVLAPIQKGINSVYNLRMDNGVLASTPLGFYRASSGLKPDKIHVEPGTFNPVDDPINDVRVLQIPYLSSFGNQEEDRLIAYTEKVLNLSDIQLGRAPQHVGVFRTASGSNDMASETNIQLEIHFDRLARTLSRLLQALFTLSRERMPEKLYYRITGETGDPIFGEVSRDSLKGQYDFEINIDILGDSRTQAKQDATMLMQMMINPAFTQTGVVTPDNLYNLAKNFLMKNKIRRVGNFITAPQTYQGDFITPSERCFRIVLDNYTDPPIENTVRMNENHQEALRIYQGFKESPHYGMLTSPNQVAALERLIAKHIQFMQAIQAGSNPNVTGVQTPRQGLGPMPGAQPTQPGAQPAPPGQGTLGRPPGEVNGPVS
jgi:hypothetical protein